jgi:uncharacterized membrane protein
VTTETATPSSPPAAPATFRSWLRTGPTAHQAGVALLTVLTAAGYAGYSLTLFYRARARSYDMVIFDQAVRSYAHFQPGISILKGVHNGFGTHFSVLGDHFSPIIAALAPLYWLYSGPQTLLIAQAVLLALTIPVLWRYSRRAFGGGTRATAAAYLVCVAYALSWPMASAVAFAFHEVAFAPVLTVLALERFQAGRPRQALLALGALLLVKEDMGLLVAGIGIAMAAARTPMVRRQRLLGASLFVLGFGYTVLAVYVIIPAFGGHSDYYWAYTSLGANAPQALSHLLLHPWSSLQVLITPAGKVHTMFWLIAVLCFLPLLSPGALVVVPLLLERMLNSRFPDWWSTHYQYNAYLEVALVCAAVDGAVRLERLAAWLASRRRRVPGAAGVPREDLGGRGIVPLSCAAAIVLCTLATLPSFAFGKALHPQFYRLSGQERAAEQAAARVPSGVQVEAANRIGPLLTSRDTVLLWDGDGKHGQLDSPWIVADVRGLEFTFVSRAAERASVAQLLRRGYRVVFSRKGYIVLHLSGPPVTAPVTGGGAG